MVREVMVVSRKNLFSKDNEFKGFLGVKESEGMLDLIMDKFEYLERNEHLEKNDSYKQIIPYVWIVNPQTKKAFVYLRANTGNESRLHNKYSGGVGGHIDKDTEDNSIDPITDAMMRELREEVLIKEYPSPKVVGYLNDETGEVERVHFGIVAVGETTLEVKPVEDMAKGNFYSVKEIDNIFSNPENKVEKWTELSWPFVREYLLNIK